MHTSLYGRLGAVAALGLFVAYSSPAHAWGYGHGMLQVVPQNGEVTGLDTMAADAEHQAASPASANANLAASVNPAAQTTANANVNTYNVSNGGATDNAAMATALPPGTTIQGNGIISR